MTPTALPTDETREHSTTERGFGDTASVGTPETDAGDRVSRAAGVFRATADQVGDRIPVAIDTVRDTAFEGARTIQAMPESRQQLLAAFSLGLGLGLSISGAPRLIVAATLAPAMFVAALILSREATMAGRT